MVGKDDVVLVTGATGFTGTYLLKLLIETGCVVRAIARPSSNRSEFSALKIDWFIGDVYSPEVVHDAMQGVNYVFHIAAAYREAKIEDQEYWNVHLESTKLLAEEAFNQKFFKRFVHVSTVGVLGHIDKPPADESSPYNPGDIYQETKAEAEKWIIQFAKETSLPITIIRPAAIYGPGDRRLLKLFKMAKLPIIPLIGFSKGFYHLIHVRDLVSFLLFVADNPLASGNIYICGSPRPNSIRDMVKVITTGMGRNPRFIRLPAWPVFLLGDICEAICRRLNVEPPIYRRRIAFFTKDRAFSTDRMQDLGYQTQVSDEEGLRQLGNWYREKGWL